MALFLTAIFSLTGPVLFYQKQEFYRARKTSVQVDVLSRGGPSKFFMLSKAIATMIVGAIGVQFFIGPIFEAVTCNPMSPIPCLEFGSNWWIIGAILGFLGGLGLLPESSNSK